MASGPEAVLRCRIDAEKLLTAHELVADLNRRGTSYPNVDAIQTAFVPHDELRAAVEEVRVPGTEPGIAWEWNLIGFAAGDVLGRLQQVAEAFALSLRPRARR